MEAKRGDVECSKGESKKFLHAPNCDGDILLVGVKQGAGFVNVEVEEVRSCLFAPHCIKETLKQAMMGWLERDCLQSIQKVRSTMPPDNFVGLLVHDKFVLLLLVIYLHLL